MSDAWDEMIYRLSDVKLAKAAIRMGRWAQASVAMVALCLLAGIWVDWRWLPTTMVPLAGVGFFGWTKTQLDREVMRRLAAMRARGPKDRASEDPGHE